MRILKVSCAILITLALISCGGGGSGSASSSPPATSYAYVVPALQSQRSYSETIVDNESNTINLSYTSTVTAINSNGTFVVLESDPSNYSVVVNGTFYSIEPVTVTYTSSGQELLELNNDTQLTCTFSPFGTGPTYPVVVGQNWSSSYTGTCGTNSPIDYDQSGSVTDLESVTVPAGTFKTLKIQFTLNYTGGNGTIYSKSYTAWRDAGTGVMVKRIITSTYAGTPLTNGYPVTTTIVLQSGVP